MRIFALLIVKVILRILKLKGKFCQITLGQNSIFSHNFGVKIQSLVDLKIYNFWSQNQN